MPQRLRAALVLLVGGAALAFAGDVVANAPGFHIPRDFLEYWSAGRVNLHGGNPYHPAELLSEQQSADPTREHAVMMWNPPPSLAVYAPLGLLGAKWAALVWVCAQLAAVFAGCDLLWRAYCPTHRWGAAVAALSFVGTWWLVAYGQNTGFLLLGLAGFLHFTPRDKPLGAGACAALTALKPHLLAVFGVLLIADALTRRGRFALGAGVAVLALALGAALATNSQVVTQFVEAVRHPAEGATPLSGWWLPVPGFWLRRWLAPESFWVQFIPCAFACAAFLVCRIRQRAGWSWAQALPLVVAVSVLTTPYGGWVFDLPVLLVPVVWALARLVRAGRFALAVAFVLAQALITAVTLATPGALHAYWWVAPAALAPCLLTARGGPRS